MMIYQIIFQLFVVSFNFQKWGWGGGGSKVYFFLNTHPVRKILSRSRYMFGS